MAKRDNGTGTIYQRANGSWVGKIYLGRDETGKEKFKYLSGKTEGEVKRKNREWEELSATFLDSNLLKNLIDSGTALLEVLTGIVDIFGAFPALATAVGTAMSFKNVGELTKTVPIPDYTKD